MTCRRAGAAAGKNKILQRRQLRVKVIQLILKPQHGFRADGSMSGQRQFRAEIEQFVLNSSEAVAYGGRNPCVAQDQTERAVGLVDRAVRFDSSVSFRYALAVGETGQTSIAATGIDLREPIIQVSGLESDQRGLLDHPISAAVSGPTTVSWSPVGISAVRSSSGTRPAISSADRCGYKG